MKITIPGALYFLYAEEEIYNALRTRVPQLPVYDRDLFYVPDKCVKSIKAMELRKQGEIIYDAFYSVQEKVRTSHAAQELLLDDEHKYHRNCWLELPLAGYEVFGTMVHTIGPRLQAAGFDIAHAFDLSGYERQIEEIEAFDFDHFPLLTNIYLVKTREFVNKNEIADEGNLRDFLGDQDKDVFGLRGKACPAHQSVRQRFESRIYYHPEGRVIVLETMRSVLRAKFNKGPAYW